MRITINGSTYLVHTEAELLRLLATRAVSRGIVHWALRLPLLVGTLTMAGVGLQAQHRAAETPPCANVCTA